MGFIVHRNFAVQSQDVIAIGGCNRDKGYGGDQEGNGTEVHYVKPPKDSIRKLHIKKEQKDVIATTDIFYEVDVFWRVLPATFSFLQRRY